MSLKSLSGKALGIVLAIAWTLGPCHVGALGIALTAMADGEHEVVLSEDSEDTLITLKHHREKADSTVCPKGHHHSAMVAWMLQGQGSRNGQHPDHSLAFHHGKAMGSDEKAVTALPDMAERIDAPGATLIAVDVLPAPRVERSANGDLLVPRNYISPTPPRSRVLLI